MKDSEAVEHISAEAERLRKRLSKIREKTSRRVKHNETDPNTSLFEVVTLIDEAVWGLSYCQQSIVSAMDVWEAANEKTKSHKQAKPQDGEDSSLGNR